MVYTFPYYHAGVTPVKQKNIKLSLSKAILSFILSCKSWIDLNEFDKEMIKFNIVMFRVLF